MNKITFKIGDKVYCPTLDNKIHELEGFICDGFTQFNIMGYGGISKSGLCLTALSFDIIKPVIIKATEENHALLEKLYGVEFEKPTVRKDPKEVIQAMLDSGAIFIPCIVADYDDNYILNFKKATSQSTAVLIYGISENGKFLSTNPYNSCYEYAVPFDIKTGKVIVDFVNGEPVLENESA